MAKRLRGFWQRGRIIDGFAVPGRALTLAIGFLAAILIIDATIAVAVRSTPDTERIQLRSAEDVVAVLERAAADPEPFLLIGDSVLVGDVMEGQVDRWQTQRVIDHLRREQAAGSEATFHQVALDGLLPVDILRIVTELDRIDPHGRVPLVIELNARFMSRLHTRAKECTRPWLCDIGVPVVDEDGIDVLAWASVTWDASLRLLRKWLPIARHRNRLDLGFDLATAPGLADPETEPPPQDRLQARVRMLEHYTRPRFGRRSAQVRAVREIVRRVNAMKRRAVFFTTPVEDAFLKEATQGAGAGRVSAWWAKLVGTGGTAELVELDHPLFSSPMFVDHCHMRPEGNRLLALNLLHELNLRLAHVPAHTDIVRPEGADATLVSQISLGNSDGPAWVAAFRKPQGIAVAPGGARVVLADTGNHCLRELSGNLQTVRTIAGQCGEDGAVDGPANKARLHSPRSPTLHDSAVYFTTADGRDLRRLARGQVSTAYTLGGPSWDRIEKIVSVESALYLQDGNRSIVRFDPATHLATTVLERGPTSAIRTFTVTPDGTLIVVDESNRIWRVGAGAPPALHIGGEVIFENIALTTLPEETRSFFPFPLDEVKLHRVVDVQWVERYGGLLVQDDIVPAQSNKRSAHVTERVALRFISFEDGLVYPWLKPLAFGGGHILYNKRTDSLVSRFHVGTMALDQRTASLFYLEAGRSRLMRIGDGLWGTARIGNVPSRRVFNKTREFFGTEAGDATLNRFVPYRFIDQRHERLPREGPYVGVFVGSSMTGSSDNVGMYSIGRRIEQILDTTLGYRDRTRLELIVRSHSGPSFKRELTAVHNLVETGAPDVVLIELRATGTFFDKDLDEASVLEHLGQLRDAVRRVDALLAFVDATPLVSRKRDGLRVGNSAATAMIDTIRGAGFVVLDPGDRMLEDHLEVSPWGSPPFGRHHVSPWAADAAAERYAAELYPLIRDHLRGRVPSRRVPMTEAAPTMAGLGPALADLRALKLEFPEVPANAVQRQHVGKTMEIFVDLARVFKGDNERPVSPDYEGIAASAIRKIAARDPASSLAVGLTIRLADFASYDEYGQGARERAKIRYEQTFDAEALETFVATVARGAPEP